MVFFWLSLCILFFAQCSYIALFWAVHGQKIGFFRTPLAFCCTIPFAPILSFIFHLTSDDDSWLRDFMDKYLLYYDFNWHAEVSNITSFIKLK